VVSSGKKMVQVPQLIDLDQQTALARLQEAGLTSQIQEECTSSKPNGLVTAQDPATGTRVPDKSAVTITVNRQLEVPPVEGQSEDDAVNILKNAGFEVDVMRSPIVFQNVVTDQSPGAGSEACKGDTVRIRVS
jgi:serine/threonine-protein kinase